MWVEKQVCGVEQAVGGEKILRGLKKGWMKKKTRWRLETGSGGLDDTVSGHPRTIQRDLNAQL